MAHRPDPRSGEIPPRKTNRYPAQFGGKRKSRPPKSTADSETMEFIGDDPEVSLEDDTDADKAEYEAPRLDKR
jgi:hypothetical protein